MTDAHPHMPPAPTDTDRIGPLVKLAGRRPMPDSSQMSDARAAAREEWMRIVKRRAWRVSLWRLTAAALALGTVSSAIWFARRGSPAPVPGVEIATVQTMTGAVYVVSDDHGRRPLSRSGVSLRSGDRIETMEDGRAAFTMAGNISIRLDRVTSAVLDSANRLTLDRGAVYLDAGTGLHDPGLRVHTVFGSVHHVGTQFEVRLQDEGLRVSVREGTVAVEREGARWTSRAGERLILGADRPVERRTVATFGPDWSWITELAQPFQLEGASVPEFLDWASRELGMSWEYEDRSLAARVQAIVLHGSIEGLTPDEAVAAVLPTCGLTSYRDRGRIIVTGRANPSRGH